MRKYTDLYKKIPLLAKIFVAIILGALLGNVSPIFFVRLLKTFCALFSELLGFLIPLIIIGLVTPAISRIGNGAGKMLGLTVLIAYVFTILSGLFAYGFSINLFPSLINTASTDALNTTAANSTPFFSLVIDPIMSVMSALIFSFILGMGIAAFKAKSLQHVFNEFEEIISSVIAKLIIPFLPLFIFGLFFDMSASGNVGHVIMAFLKVIVVIFIMSIVLLVLQFAIAGLVARRNPFKLLYNMLPAYLTALGTSSSAATIPVTLKQTRHNRVKPEVAGFVIPLCATIHLSGSTLKITSCAIALMMLNHMPMTFMQIFGFVLMLGVTMVAAPGVPGGAIMAALGVLQSLLGFDSAQQAMMITLYIAMDSFGTACNVTGDGAIAVIIDAINKEKHHEEEVMQEEIAEEIAETLEETLAS